MSNEIINPESTPPSKDESGNMALEDVCYNCGIVGNHASTCAFYRTETSSVPPPVSARKAALEIEMDVLDKHTSEVDDYNKILIAGWKKLSDDYKQHADTIKGILDMQMERDKRNVASITELEKENAELKAKAIYIDSIGLHINGGKKPETDVDMVLVVSRRMMELTNTSPGEVQRDLERIAERLDEADKAKGHECGARCIEIAKLAETMCREVGDRSGPWFSTAQELRKILSDKSTLPALTAGKVELIRAAMKKRHVLVNTADGVLAVMNKVASEIESILAEPDHETPKSSLSSDVVKLARELIASILGNYKETTQKEVARELRELLGKEGGK